MAVNSSRLGECMTAESVYPTRRTRTHSWTNRVGRFVTLLLAGIGLNYATAEDAKPNAPKDSKPKATAGAEYGKLTTAVRVRDDGEDTTTDERAYFTRQLGLHKVDVGVRHSYPGSGSPGDDLVAVILRPSLTLETPSIDLDKIRFTPMLAVAHEDDELTQKIEAEVELMKGGYGLTLGGVYGSGDDFRLDGAWGIVSKGRNAIALSHLKHNGESKVGTYAALDLTDLGLKDVAVFGGTRYDEDWFVGTRVADKYGPAGRVLVHFDPSGHFRLGDGIHSVDFFITDFAYDVSHGGATSIRHLTSSTSLSSGIRGEHFGVSPVELSSHAPMVPDRPMRGRVVFGGKLTDDDIALQLSANPLYQFGEWEGSYVAVGHGFRSGNTDLSAQLRYKLGEGHIIALQGGHGFNKDGPDNTEGRLMVILYF